MGDRDRSRRSGRRLGDLDGSARPTGDLDGSARPTGDLDGSTRLTGDLDGSTRLTGDLEGSMRRLGERRPRSDSRMRREISDLRSGEWAPFPRGLTDLSRKRSEETSSLENRRMTCSPRVPTTWISL